MKVISQKTMIRKQLRAAEKGKSYAIVVKSNPKAFRSLLQQLLFCSCCGDELENLLFDVPPKQHFTHFIFTRQTGNLQLTLYLKPQTFSSVELEKRA